MADVGTPSAVDMSTSNAGAEPSKEKTAPPAKPERPDEEVYKTDLAKAEKELKAAEERMVSDKSPKYSMRTRDGIRTRGGTRTRR